MSVSLLRIHTLRKKCKEGTYSFHAAKFKYSADHVLRYQRERRDHLLGEGEAKRREMLKLGDKCKIIRVLSTISMIIKSLTRQPNNIKSNKYFKLVSLSTFQTH